MKFTAELAPLEARYEGGYSSNGRVDPCTWANEMFGRALPGPELACYMLRRFGWPNIGSDPYKNLCSWSLTTRIEGLYLTVTPYLGNDHSNLHFGVLFSKETGAELDRDPQREKYWRQREAAIRRWWDREGSRLYVIDQRESNEGVLKTWSEGDGSTVGLWARGSARRHKIPRIPARVDGWFWHWMAEFLEERHQLVLPTPPRSVFRLTAFQRRAKAALKATMRDLLVPVRVRDVPIFLGPVKGSAYKEFEGAGCTPEYWYSARRKRHEREKSK